MVQRRRRDLNPRTAINSLLPFQGSPFNHLGTSAWLRVILLLFTFSPLGQKVSGEGGIRTHAPLRTNGFQDRLVMTTSIPLRNCLIIISHQANNVKHLFLFFQKNFIPRELLYLSAFFQHIILSFLIHIKYIYYQMTTYPLIHLIYYIFIGMKLLIKFNYQIQLTCLIFPRIITHSKAIITFTLIKINITKF